MNALVGFNFHQTQKTLSLFLENKQFFSCAIFFRCCSAAQTKYADKSEDQWKNICCFSKTNALGDRMHFVCMYFFFFICLYCTLFARLWSLKDLV